APLLPPAGGRRGSPPAGRREASRHAQAVPARGPRQRWRSSLQSAPARLALTLVGAPRSQAAAVARGAYRAAYAPVRLHLQRTASQLAEAVMTITRDHPWVGEPKEHPVVVGIEAGQDPHVLDRAREFAERFGTGVLCVWVDPGHLVVSAEMAGSVATVPVDPDDADEDPTEVEGALIEFEQPHLQCRGWSW